MKRPRSYGENLDDDSVEKAAASKDWHRRFYSKGSSSSSYDRSIEEDRESSWRSRKRFEHEQDGFDRRRYRDDRVGQVTSSSRCYGRDRLHRSESFSMLRREIPKGFRSERDRSRREASSGSSWQRSWGADEMRSPSVTSDSAGRGNYGLCESQGKERLRDESSKGREGEMMKPDKVQKNSCSSSEMEEGELEPDPEVDAVEEPSSHSKSISLEPENCKDRENSSENKEILVSENKLVIVDDGACDGREEGADKVRVPSPQDDIVKESNGEDEVEGNLEGNGQEISKEEILSLLSSGTKLKGQGEEWADEETKVAAVTTFHPPLAEKLEEDGGEGQCVGTESGDRKKEETCIDLEVRDIEGRGFDPEVEMEGSSCKEFATESTHDEDVRITKEIHKDKGKRPVISLVGKVDSTRDDNDMEGTSGRGFELVFSSDVKALEQVSCDGGVAIEKLKDEKPKLEPLDLSLGLPGIPLDHNSKSLNGNHCPPSRALSIQSLPSSFQTISDGFTNSISFSGSQTFVHNPSCSLTQNSMDNYEHSVGSHPIFQPVDSSGTLWQAQTLNEPMRKGGVETLFERVKQNGNPPYSPLHSLKGQHQSKPDGLSRQSSFPRQFSHGSHDTRSENSNDKRLLARARSSSSLFRREQKKGDLLVLNDVSVVERILSKIVTEPLQVTSRMLHEMTEHSIAFLRETIRDMVSNTDKHGQVQALQEVLQRRSDITMETLSRSSRVLLEILVALKRGLPVIWTKDNIQPSDLVEMFLNLKCCNPSCRSMLPVDECDCRICMQKNGFCRECMCLVCSKFDNASNTCSWVGCDVCLHWCHTDCGLRESHIRNGSSASGMQGSTEMQFHCTACDHPSEMFGFVKEVFKTCVRGWKAGTLTRELQYVRMIFSASKDTRGKRLCDLAEQMLLKLEHKVNLSEVVNYIMAFLYEGESNISNGPSVFPPKEPSRSNAAASSMIACSSKEATWLPSISADKDSPFKNMGVLSSMGGDRTGRQARDAELQVNLEKKPAIDELDRMVRLKQAEAKMYQERADDARREAEGLKRIAVAKNVKTEEDYATHIAKLRLREAEERRRQKLEELQGVEREHREYFNLKTRMEADIKDLLVKMEATRRNFST